MTTFSDFFKPINDGIFMSRQGPANKGTGEPSAWKICLTATDEAYLAKLLYELSQRPDCIGVKYSPAGSPKCRDGMLLGRIGLETFEATANLWAELRTDKKLMCSVQDDAALDKYRV